MAKSNHNKYVSYPDWFGSSTSQPTQQLLVTQTIYHGGGGSSGSSGGAGLTGVVTQGSGNAVTSGMLDGTTLVLNKDLTFITEQSRPLEGFWELRLTIDGKEYLYANYDIATSGGHTMYVDGDAELNLPGIYDGLPIDGDTIYWEETENGRILKSKYEGSSGVDASEVLSIVSNAGYATQNWVNSQNFISSSFLYTELAKYVKIKDYQEIEGVKNFLNGLQIAGLPITKLSGYEDVIYIDANVVVRGGLTMYYEDGEIDLPTIKDEIGNAGYDGVTGLASFNSSQFSISSDGTVTIIGGSTGLDTAQLKDYLDSNKYTTETWVKAQGYASASSLSSLQTKVNNFLEGSDTDTVINKWKELETFLSGLTESDNLATILTGKADKSYVDTNFVTLGTKQTITGEKNFTGGLKVNGSPIYYDATNKYWKLEGDLLVTGGVSMYSDDSAFTPSTIMDALELDNTTIRRNPTSGVLEVIGGSGATVKYPLSWSGFNQGSYDGSVARSFYIPTKLSEFVNDKSFATTSDLSGYLPLSGGTITSSALTPLLVKGEHNGKAVTFRLANIDRSVADFGHTSEDGVYIQDFISNYYIGVKTDGTPYFWNGSHKTLLHSDNYSSYALPLSGGTMTGGVVIAPSASYTTSITDNCTVLKLGSDTSGMNGYNSGLGFNALQRYSSAYPMHLHAWIGLSPCINSAGSELYDLVFATNGSTTVNTSPVERIRITNDGSVKIQKLFFGNTNEINSTDGTTLCLNYEGTGNILMSNNGQGVIVASGWGGLSSITQQRLRKSMFSVRGGIFSYMEDIMTNAASYVFDKPGQWFTGIGSNGEGDTIYFGAVDASNCYSWVPYSQKWKFGGSIITTGGITMYSDQRKKTILNHVELSLKQIADAPLIEYYYNSDQNKTTHVGSIAQYWAGLNDWFCKLDNEGYYTMEVQNCALASAISIARHLEKYESKTDKKIRMLKKRITELEDKLEKLEGGNYGCR